MKDQRKCMVHFEDKGMFPKDVGGFRKVPSQNTSGVRVMEDFGGFRKVPSKNTSGVRVMEDFGGFRKVPSQNS